MHRYFFRHFWMAFPALGCREVGLSPKGGPVTLQPAWTAKLPDGGYWLGQPAVDGGRVFVQAGNQLLGLDAATGAVRWSRGVRVAPTPPPTTPIARDGVVYLSEADSVLAVEGASGRTLWAFRPDSQAVVAPALDEAALYTGQRGLPVVYALARADGRLRWRTDVDPRRGTGFPALVQGAAVSGDTVYVAVRRALAPTFYTTAGLLVALDRRDGRVLWRYDLEEGGHHGFTTGPLLAGRLVIVGDFDGQAVVAYDPAAGRVAWRAPLPLAAARSLTLDGGTVYVAGTDGYAYALDAATGARRWRSEAFSTTFGGVVCRGAFFMNDQRVRRFDAVTGRYTGESTAGALPPLTSGVASDGDRVFVTSASGAYAIPCG